MSIPRQYAAGDPIWYDRSLPTLEDFDGDESAFDQAMADYVTQQNGPQLADVPNFGIPEQQVYNHQTGQYETRGGLPTRFEGMSENELAANQLNARFGNIAKKQAAGMYSPAQRSMDLLALQSRAQVRPEEMQAAYNATRADGTAVLADPVLTYFESLGFVPTGDYNWLPPEVVQSPEEIAANWQAARDQLGVDDRAAEIAARRAQMAMQEGAVPGLTFEDIINSGMAIPGAPGFTRDDIDYAALGLDPSTFLPISDEPMVMTPEDIEALRLRLRLAGMRNRVPGTLGY